MAQGMDPGESMCIISNGCMAAMVLYLLLRPRPFCLTKSSHLLWETFRVAPYSLF